jgi:predicted nucleic acid-binding protein
MAVPAPHRPRFALDTNVLIDLGEGLPFAQRFLATFRSSGLAAPPTVVQELVHIAIPGAQVLRAKSLSRLRQSQVEPQKPT